MFRRKLYGFAALLLLGAYLPAIAAQLHTSHAKNNAERSPKQVPVASEPSKAASDAARTAEQTKQTEARKIQEAALKAQQAQARYAEETAKLQQEQARQTQEVARIHQTQAQEAEEAERLKKEAVRKAHQRELQQMPSEEELQTADKQNKAKEPTVDQAELEFQKTQGEILRTSFSGPRKTTDRNQLPPINARGASQKAATQPFIIKNASGSERRQAQQYQQNLQSRLFTVPAAQTPSSFSELKSAQINTFFNNYPAYVNHQSININKKNTYILEVPPTNYPVWYERTPGWTYCNGFILGSSVQVGSDWFSFDWPSMFGTVPAGFLCPVDYFPTPWIYSPFNDRWRRAGETQYKSGPDPEYTGPITVEAIEPITAKMPDQWGVPVFQTINVIYFYNAFYNPEFERWGYVNKQGSFVWLNI